MTEDTLIPTYAKLTAATLEIRKVYDSLPAGTEKDRVNIVAAHIAAVQLEIAGWMDEMEAAAMQSHRCNG